MSQKLRIINLNQLDYKQHSSGDAFEAELAAVTNRLVADKLGYRITRLAPGKRAFPRHAHFSNEEMFFILKGQGTFYIGDEQMPVREGDFIAAPADPELAHQIHNTSNQQLSYLCVSTMLEPEVAIYPDSNKIGILAGNPPGRTENPGITKFFNADADVDYWQDES